MYLPLLSPNLGIFFRRIGKKTSRIFAYDMIYKSDPESFGKVKPFPS